MQLEENPSLRIITISYCNKCFIWNSGKSMITQVDPWLLRSFSGFQNDLPLRYFFHLFECFKLESKFHFDVADHEVICLEPKKIEEKRPAGRPRKYHKLTNWELDINELHDINDVIKVDQ